MAAPTPISTNSKSQDSRLKFGNLAAAAKGVESVTTTTVVLDDVVGLNGATLYSAGRPGMLVIIDGIAAGDTYKTANITGFVSGTRTLTVNVDLTASLNDASIVAVIPPESVEVFLNGAPTIGVTVNDDEGTGLNETFVSHMTRAGAEVGGNIPLFLIIDSAAVGRIIAAGVGGYKKTGAGSSVVHKYRPLKANDGTFADSSDFTVFKIEGNRVFDSVMYALFGTQLVIDFPQRPNVATLTLGTKGAGAVSEGAGAGKTFPTGANNWDSVVNCDGGDRHTFQGVFMQLGGSFGGALDKDLMDRFVQNLTVTIDRTTTDASVLGNQFPVKPIEQEHKISVAGQRLFEDNSIHAKYWNGAEPGQKQTTRLLIKAVSAKDATKTLTIDIPLGIFDSTVNWEKGFMKESFTFKGRQTLTAAKCIDPASPLYQIEYANGDDVDYLVAL